MTTDLNQPRAGSPLAAGLVGLLMSAGYAGAWYVTVERPTCEQAGVFACAGPGILMTTVGVPVTYVLWSLGLRAVRAPLPWLAPVAVMAALVGLVEVAELVEPPTWVWPLVAGIGCALWARLVSGQRRRPIT